MNEFKDDDKAPPINYQYYGADMPLFKSINKNYFANFHMNIESLKLHCAQTSTEFEKHGAIIYIHRW